MASTFSIISTVFLTTGVLFLLQGVALVAVYLVKWRDRGKSGAERDDHANMMILFQSMRDLLHEQKQLARQLNEDIDRKLTRINLVVHEALDSARRPATRPPSTSYGAPRGRTTSEPDARGAFLREARKLSGQSGAKESDAESPQWLPPRASQRISPDVNLVDTPARPLEPAEGFRAVAEPGVDEGPTGEHFNAWVGLDFADDAPNPFRVEVPEQPPASPEDADRARAAFRTLLDLQQDAPAASAAEPPRTMAGIGKVASVPVSPPANETNGARKITPLQRRVQEYSDAGMSVPQIARELGIGKGEVRLILSLREGRKA